MARQWQLYVGCVLIMQMLASCSDEPTSDSAPATSTRLERAAAPIAGGKLVLAFGDSLYAGYGIAQHESFPHELENALKAMGQKVEVRNAGVSGETTQAGLQRLEYTLDGLPHRPDLVLLGLGGNDMLRGLDPKQSEKNLRAMLDTLKARKLPVVLTGMLAAPNMGADYSHRFNAIYPALARDYGVPLYPFFLEGVIGNPEYMQSDSIHPNPEGVHVIVSKIAPMVSDNLLRGKSKPAPTEATEPVQSRRSIASAP